MVTDRSDAARLHPKDHRSRHETPRQYSADVSDRDRIASAVRYREIAFRHSGYLELAEPAAGFWPQYPRGQAYLRLKQGTAAAEFQGILAHRGYAPLSPLYPLAHLDLARAAAIAGEPESLRKLLPSLERCGCRSDPELRRWP